MQPPSDSPAATLPPLAFGRVLFAEGLGTFLLVFLGCGAVHAAVLLGARSGNWQVAIPGLDESGWLTVYILAPILGGMAEDGLHPYWLRPANQSAPITSYQPENS